MTTFFSQLRISQQIFAIAVVALIGFALSIGEITLKIHEAEADAAQVRVAAEQSVLANLLQAEALSRVPGSAKSCKRAAIDIRKNVSLLLDGGKLGTGEDESDIDPVNSDLRSLFAGQIIALQDLEVAAGVVSELGKNADMDALENAQKDLRDAASRFVANAQEGLHRLQALGESDLVGLGIWSGAIALIFGSLAIFFGLFVAKKISRSVQDTIEAVRSVGDGDLTVSLNSHSSREMRELSIAVTETVQHMSSAVLSRSVKWSEVAEQKRTDLAAQKKAKETLLVVSAAKTGDLRGSIASNGDGVADRIARGFDSFLATIRGSLTDISKSSDSLVGSVEQMTGSTQQVERNATETSDRASAVSAASTEISRSVETVAAGIEELGASIKEISRNTTEAARVASNAVTVAEDTNTTVKKLGASSGDIGKVVTTITSIAQQTNLLALNATIEAARAGEAGKGFAVVASEVKELARETASATEEISVKIEAIQSDTERAVQAIESISLIIGEISDIQNNIASAVEEQTATANEIGNSISDAAAQTSEIAENIASVASGATQTQRLAESNQERAKAMTALASDLDSLLAGFRLK